jgi:hypothetical protein
MIITSLFALGHGLMLFIFAKVLESVAISDELLGYGDMVSATVIIGMGLYLLFMVATNRIQLRKHIHGTEEHVHIWFGKSHEHSNADERSSFALGILMGIGGVRGMLITLGVVAGGTVNFTMVGAFTAGVMLVFMSFGMLILYINKNFLGNLTNVRRVFTTAGVISLLVGTNILIG